MYRICKSFDFSAAHFLPKHKKCGKMHGHTWRVDITLASEILNQDGMVRDFSDFSTFRNYIGKHFDHAVINETLPIPTAENIARLLFDFAASQSAMLESVRVWESATSWAEYSR
jgi:6-pyruvoyltetrahydropterin/6-carboxytetrahydropterin synthase